MKVPGVNVDDCVGFFDGSVRLLSRTALLPGLVRVV